MIKKNNFSKNFLKKQDTNIYFFVYYLSENNINDLFINF
jgi:hypothetical protein